MWKRVRGIGVGLLLFACTKSGPPVEVPVVVRNHEEVFLRDDGILVPLFFGDGEIGLCIDAKASEDTSRWKMEVMVGGQSSPSGVVPVTARTGPTVCFDAHLPAEVEGMVEACGRLVDDYDGTVRGVPCQPVRVERDTAAFNAAQALRMSILEEAAGGSLDEVLNRLDELSRRASTNGFHLLSVQTTLIAVYYLTLEGTPEALAQAGVRLESLPSWLDQAPACNLAALAAYQRALYYLDSEGRLRDAWAELAQANDHYQEIADPKRFTVTMQEASILHVIGAGDEAIARARGALADCRHLPCDRDLLVWGENDLAWLLILHPHAGEAELEEARHYLEAGLERLGDGADPQEVANVRLTLAYLQVRQGGDPGNHLRLARELLGGDRRRERNLKDWADLVEGSAALARGDAATALELCTHLADRLDSTVAAWALSCSARAHRLTGDLAEAEEVLGEGLLIHAYGDLQEITPGRKVGPGHRADDFARAARLAIERGAPERAWRYLFDLDQLTVGEAVRRRCREEANAEMRARWNEIDARMDAILGEVGQLEKPAAPQHRERQLQIVQELKIELREMWNEWPGCEARPEVDDEGLQYRAVALEDEILLLHRHADGRVEVEKRTPFRRTDLRRLQERVMVELEEQKLDDQGWSEMLEPVARALLPGDLESVRGELVTYGLHGLLQAVPLPLLPLPENEGGWSFFGQFAVVAQQSAGAQADPTLVNKTAPPLFVVDPNANLPTAPQLLTGYRQLFPNALILNGERATHSAFLAEAGRACWLHVDAHGLYDPAFPELAALDLADRPIHWVELADAPMRFLFVHLSGCQTGRWPITADSGSYGLAGLMTRLGVGWAIASRTMVQDDVARDFNQVFYRSIAARVPVPDAYQNAVLAVARQHPAGAWGGLLLLRAAGAGQPP